MISGLMPLGSDWWLAGPALNALAVVADEILVAKDASGRGFSGVQDPDSRETLSMPRVPRDVWNKIRWIFAPLFVHGQHSKSTERSVRNALSWLAAGVDEQFRWLLSIDADEVVQNPEELRSWLLAPPNQGLGTATARFTDVWKVIGETALVAPDYQVSIATQRRGAFLRGRGTSDPNVVQSPARVIHWTLGGRTAEQIRLKLSTCGHADELGSVRIAEFVETWESTTLDNFAGLVNVSPYGKRRPGWRYPYLRAVPLAELGGLPSWAWEVRP